MKINNITQNPISNNRNNKQLSFQRKLREDEKADYGKTMNEAFDYLGVENRALIIHGSSFPSKKNTNIQGYSSGYTLTILNGKKSIHRYTLSFQRFH